MNNLISTRNRVVNKKLSLGFMGIGWIGRNRMKVLLEDGHSEASVIFEPFQQNADEALKLAPKAQLLQNSVDFYEHPEVNGVVIATPSALHASQSINALLAGKAVFCQKPLGCTAKEVRQVINASKQVDKYLAVDLSYRFTEAFQAVFNTIQRGEIGEVYAVNLVFHNAYGPDKDWFYDIRQSGGGCVMDLGVHMIDMALNCLGFPYVEQVRSHLYSKGKKLVPGAEEVEDLAKVSMITAKNTAIDLDCSWHVSEGRDAVMEATFYGSEGRVAFKNIDGSFSDFKAEKYNGTQTEQIAGATDEWSGRAGLEWAQKVLDGQGFDPGSANEYLQLAEIIDRVYGRQT